MASATPAVGERLKLPISERQPSLSKSALEESRSGNSGLHWDRKPEMEPATVAGLNSKHPFDALLRKNVEDPIDGLGGARRVMLTAGVNVERQPAATVTMGADSDRVSPSELGGCECTPFDGLPVGSMLLLNPVVGVIYDQPKVPGVHGIRLSQ
jgi:hypothetical protein